MKKITKLLAFLAIGAFALSCEKPEEQKPNDEDPVVAEKITVTPASLEVSHEAVTEVVAVEANCEYTVEAAEWITATQAEKSLSLAIAANEGAERTATVTLKSNTDQKALATIEVKQAAKPEAGPVDPPADGSPLTLVFDFSTAATDEWPSAAHEGKTVKYTLEGKDYDFLLSTNCFTYLSSADIRYVRVEKNNAASFGLPAIPGKKLLRIEIDNLAQKANQRQTVILDGPDAATANEVTAMFDMAKVQTYKVDITEPEVNKVYYISAKYTEGNFIGFKGVTLHYGTEPLPPLEKITVNPASVEVSHEAVTEVVAVEANCEYTVEADEWITATPADGSLSLAIAANEGSARTGTVSLKSKTEENEVLAKITVTQAEKPVETPADALVLDFDFSIAPLEGWPTENALVGVTNVEGGIDCIYPLDGVNFTFNLADCLNASKGSIFWAPGDAPCFKIGAEKRFLGFPAIEGKKLVKAEVYSIPNGNATKTPQFVIISGDVPDVSVDKASYPIVAGGEAQSPAKKGEEPKVLTYNLTGTEAGVVYRFASLGGGIYFTRLILTYTE